MLCKKYPVEKLIPWLILLAAIISSIIVYRHFKQPYIQAVNTLALFENATAVDEAFQSVKSLAEQAGSETIRVIYFWQAYCPCNAPVLSHYNAMQREYSDKGIRFLLADLSPAAEGYSVPFDKLVDNSFAQTLKSIVTYTPSVAIWDANNNLSYYGPHSLGFVCNAETSFVKKVIDTLLTGVSSVNVNTLGEGCFCST